MKKTILAVCLGAMPVLAFAAAYEISINQRSASNTSWIERIPANPPGTNHGMFWIDGNTKVLKWVTPVGATYDGTTNTLTYIGTQADWNAVSGPASILNKPTIPAAQVQSDWNAISGMGHILNKPSIPAAQVNSDWSSSSGLSQILNKPTLAAVATSGQYSDLAGTPSIPAAQVQTDWNAVSGLGVLLNKPSLATVATSGAYADLTGKPSLFDGAWGSLTGKPAWASTFDGSYGSLTSIPSSFVPTAHTHAATDIVSGTLADARIPSLAISKTTGLQAALDAKFPIPAGTTGQYVRGDGSLATFPAGAVFAVGAPNTRSMSLATAYQCTDNTKPCLFTITLQAQSSISLSGAVNNEGQVLIGSTNAVASGTGTPVGRYANNLGGTLVIGLNLTSAQANSYSIVVPAGWYIASRQTAGSGLTVVAAYDQAMSN